MENEKILEELKQQTMQQYGITQEQIEAFVAAFDMLYAAAKEVVEKFAALYWRLAELIDAGALEEAIEAVQEAIKAKLPPPYDRADTRNAQYNAKLKSYKNKICSAAIRKPRGVARSCC